MSGPQIGVTFAIVIVIVLLGRFLFKSRNHDKKPGDWQRHIGNVVITCHPGSELGLSPRELAANNWRFIGVTKEHGLLVFEDFSFRGRMRKFLGTGRDDLHQRSLSKG